MKLIVSDQMDLVKKNKTVLVFLKTMVGARTTHHDESNDKLFWFLPTEDGSGGLEGTLGMSGKTEKRAADVNQRTV